MKMYYMFRDPARVLMKLNEPFRVRDIKKCLDSDFHCADRIKKILVVNKIIVVESYFAYPHKYIFTKKGRRINYHFKKLVEAYPWKN